MGREVVSPDPSDILTRDEFENLLTGVAEDDYLLLVGHYDAQREKIKALEQRILILEGDLRRLRQ